MSFQIIRVEDTVDRDGHPEMFVQVEYTDVATGTKVPFSRWLFQDHYQSAKADPAFLDSLVASWEESTVQEYIIEHGIQNPNQISKRQARLALLQSGLLETVNAAVESAGEAARIEWEYADFILRDSPLLNSLASSLGMSSTDLDNLFALARQL